MCQCYVCDHLFLCVEADDNVTSKCDRFLHNERDARWLHMSVQLHMRVLYIKSRWPSVVDKFITFSLQNCNDDSRAPTSKTLPASHIISSQSTIHHTKQ